MDGRAKRGAWLTAGVVAGLLVGSGGLAVATAASESGEIVACAGEDAALRVETSAGKVTPWNRVAVGEGQEEAMAYTRTVVLDSPGPLSLKCFAKGRSSDAVGEHVTFYHQSLTATRVGKITVYPWPTWWPQSQ
ncbi:hypothetical protein ACQP2K_32825 [Microbispora siamensis]